MNANNEYIYELQKIKDSLERLENAGSNTDDIFTEIGEIHAKIDTLDANLIVIDEKIENILDKLEEQKEEGAK